MFKDYSKFKFTVVDVDSTATPEMFVNSNGITFNQSVLDMLGNPDYVCPLIDYDNKYFAVQVTAKKDGKYLYFGKNKDQKRGFSSTCCAVRTALRKLMADKWNDNSRYKMTGVLFPEVKAMVFELGTATELRALTREKKHN